MLKRYSRQCETAPKLLKLQKMIMTLIDEVDSENIDSISPLFFWSKITDIDPPLTHTGVDVYQIPYSQWCLIRPWTWSPTNEKWRRGLCGAAQ